MTRERRPMNKQHTVAIAACADYEPGTVDAAFEKALELAGGIADIVKPGMRVFVKTNLVARKAPTAAATTHPEVIRTVCEAVRRCGATAVIGDSPGGPLSAALLKSYYKFTGMSDAAERSGAELSLDTGTAVRPCPDGKVIKQLDITAMAQNADAVISVGKLKTHGMTMMTGCVKNLFGCVPGVTKVEYHSRFNKVQLFSDMLVDIEEAIKPVLNVLDAVDGMEGEGPSGGTPRHIGALLVSRNAHELDAIAARIIGLEPSAVCTLDSAMKRGLLRLDEIELAGDAPERFVIRDYVYPKAVRDIKLFSTVPVVGTLLNLISTPRPVFDEGKCVKCGFCERSCPGHAITLAPYPRADLKKCIRCFCCQELCPQHAVEARRSLIRRLFK